jgi:filamentous hemagglutinin
VGESHAWVHNGCGPNQSEASASRKIKNAVRDHVTPSDLSGTVADGHGAPIPHPQGGFWDHAKEAEETLRGLRKNTGKLAGSSDPALQATRQEGINAIRRIEDAILGNGI